MEISQIYETTVADRVSGHAVRFLVVPCANLDDTHWKNEPTPNELESVLGLQGLRHVSAAALPQAIAGMLKADANEAEVLELQAQAVLDHVMQTATFPPAATAPDAEMIAFAEHVAFSAVVPFEESPLALVSLASKAAALSKNGVALGAFIGVIAGGTTPLLLVTVPARIILCASAVAFAKVIDAKRSDIFADLLGVGAARTTEPPPAPDTGEAGGGLRRRRR